MFGCYALAAMSGATELRSRNGRRYCNADCRWIVFLDAINGGWKRYFYSDHARRFVARFGLSVCTIGKKA